MIRPIDGTAVLWLVWLAVWLAAAFSTNNTVKRPRLRQEILYRATVLAAAALLLLVSRRARLHSLNGAEGWSLAGVMALGIAFTFWARFYLGRLWSGTITRKEQHRVVDTGPYALVRHPIYSGLILAAIATVVIQARPLAYVALVLFIVSFVIKARLEEQFLKSELGAAYDDYAARVPMLIPFWPTPRTR